MTTFDTILTHPGGAHKDEFLACSVLLALHPVPVVRREPTDDDLNSPATCVVDVGHRHEPALHNFDHHQLPKDHPPTCSLSLVLQHLGLYADALAKLVSPIDITVLRRFALAKRLDPGQPLWEIMRMIGEDLLDYVKSLRTRLDFIARHAEIWTVDIGGQPAKILFLTRTDPLPDDPSMGIDRYIEISGLADEVVGTVSPDRRSTGYGLSRFRDSARLDFTRIADQPGVHFAHARGFVAKTSLTDLAQLKVLLALSGVAPARP